MSDSDTVQTLLKLLSRWCSDQPLGDNSQVRLICHQPHNGDLAYLHCLYEGLSKSEIADIEAAINQPLPLSLRDFYTATNGARLFESQVCLSGLVKNFSRNPLNRNPICIEQDNRAFAAMRPKWHAQGYIRIGGVSFLRQDEMICGPDGDVVILHAETGESLRRYTDIYECMESFAQEMASFWTVEGDFTGDWATIDNLLLGTCGTA